MRIGQLNANHSWGAQDLILQWARENEAALVCIVEPYAVSQSPLWFGDRDNTAAIFWSLQCCPSDVIPMESGDGFVAVRTPNLQRLLLAK